MNINSFRLVILISEVALGTYLAIHQGIGFWWAFFAIYGAHKFEIINLHSL
jgi:hypothetical protein